MDADEWARAAVRDVFRRALACLCAELAMIAGVR